MIALPLIPKQTSYTLIIFCFIWIFFCNVDDDEKSEMKKNLSNMTIPLSCEGNDKPQT